MTLCIPNKLRQELRLYKPLDLQHDKRLRGVNSLSSKRNDLDDNGYPLTSDPKHKTTPFFKTHTTIDLREVQGVLERIVACGGDRDMSIAAAASIVARADYELQLNTVIGERPLTNRAPFGHASTMTHRVHEATILYAAIDRVLLP
jgi:hypothetical protein